MPTITVVGAGPGLGLAIARRFGREGFNVALLARTREKLDTLVAELATEGITAAGFTADILDPSTVAPAFEAMKERFGSVDVFEFSPAPHSPISGFSMDGPLDVTYDNLQPQLEYYLYGAITAAQQVLPAMLEAGKGTLLFTTGGGSISPSPIMGNVNAAQAALRNWVLNVHQVVAKRGVYAAHVAISAWIGQTPGAEPSTIAELYWDLYIAQTQAEAVFTVPVNPDASAAHAS
ncbi:SDR family NAD(P)-dependent oxidoreductase (plasmid) [Deinococcus sp. KNUC1210]|uniref:SDR family NAD(P)-dependent oxidoreductase n=1 Tax=Deinococcus sp. KNUC1210 TaxID=2917691 RepID=UPI001EEFABDA|nr:SDR family NAD(P)-dependent oxidoreductase [Deinococcus sp. KNUC1210]ULH18166.1 SDR family NAD(P)-dependent oxidoreductase [Deinococcus sp. KNUC1210]